MPHISPEVIFLTFLDVIAKSLSLMPSCKKNEALPEPVEVPSAFRAHARRIARGIGSRLTFHGK